ncbi:SLBB domain-containing protein [Mucilaginibacter sp. CSA2-8R]|uniref:SLBB domain-containing protein n=1 Tax=Mucilaginibacter sp. CSA2-8R TaxID=3141542 RepID=UPI00315DFABB
MNDLKNAQVSQASDEQIIQAWKKIQDAGISEQDAYKILQQKGMPASEVEALKNRITLLGLNKKSTGKSSTGTEAQKIDFTRPVIDSMSKPQAVAKQPEKISPPQLTIYGTEFFNQTSIKFEPNFSGATPKGYILGPGDEVIVLVTGLNETSVRSKISPDGNLQIPYAGVIYVNGFSIEQATSIIRSRLTKIYPALNSGQTQLTVNLGTTRSIRITITGEVKTPGSYTLSSLATVYNALYNSGGPTNNGSLRNIELIRANRVYRTIDFYSFLQRGLLDGNIRLEDQDVIRIPVYRKRVSINGEVKRPAIYELKDNETLENLIAYAGGYTDVAYKGTAKVDQINTLEREVKDVPSNLFGNYIPRNGDIIQIGAITNRYTNRITLEGSVYRPGTYELSVGFTLAQLLKNAQGLKPEAYMERGYIKRTLPNLQRDFISFKPTDIINGRNDIPLLREDSVVILDQNIFISNQKITVNGFVRKPATFTYRKGLKLADAIAMSGGFDDEAADHHVEVSRIIKNESDSVANQLVQTFVVDMDNPAAQRDVELQPMDYIYVPRLVNYRSLGNVSVKGEVVFPGDYAVQKRDETAIEFLERAGGITPYGSLENAQVYRKGVRVNLNLTTTHPTAAEKRDLILLPGDSVYIPRVISYVEVSGAVNNPQYVSFSGHRFKYYINAAAGVTQNARLRGAYIKYPNGLNQPVKRFLFFRNYPKVLPGSKIIVPEKTPDNRFKINFGDLAGISTAITALIGLVSILRR